MWRVNSLHKVVCLYSNNYSKLHKALKIILQLMKTKLNKSFLTIKTTIERAALKTGIKTSEKHKTTTTLPIGESAFH